MKVLDIDDAGPQYALGAAIDAQAQHKKYWGIHSSVKQNIALTLKQLAVEAYGYTGSKVYMTARENFIAVKVDKPKVSTTWLRSAELSNMHAFARQHGIEPLATVKNLVFRVAK